jgi:phenylalanyl-tRNA synthetase beta chain
MKFTKDWLNDHLKTKKSEQQIIEKLNGIGLEVEKVEPIKNELSDFIVAKIIKTNKHPNADRLKLCDVDIGGKATIKVVCGAPNAQDGLVTIYAPPGSIIPKNGMKLEVSKIRGETSYGMLCSESELKLSNESEGIIELSKKFNHSIGKQYFKNKNNSNVIELSITPNRPDCLGIRGIARDLFASGYGELKEIKDIKFKKTLKHYLKVKIEKNKNQACSIFGSCLIKNIKNKESPSWLKERILALGLRPISAVVDITNYVMFDLNRPLHAYDLDKIKNSITIRNSKNGEILKALDNKTYTLKENMCVIADDEGPLGLGGIIGGIRSGTELDTKNVLIESAYFDPGITRKTAKLLEINSDAKFRFERGIDPQSVKDGLLMAVKLIVEICGGEVSNFDIQETIKYKKKIIKFDPKLVSKTIGIDVKEKNITNILNKLGFETQ